MLGLLKVPRIRITDYETKYEIEVLGLLQPIPKGTYSFIVDRNSLPDIGFRVEAYPWTNEVGNEEELIIYTGHYSDCLDILNQILKVIEDQSIPHKHELLDAQRPPEAIRYPYFYNERVRSIYSEH